MKLSEMTGYYKDSDAVSLCLSSCPVLLKELEKYQGRWMPLKAMEGKIPYALIGAVVYVLNIVQEKNCKKVVKSLSANSYDAHGFQKRMISVGQHYIEV